jgi:hypothetical protein
VTHVVQGSGAVRSTVKITRWDNGCDGQPISCIAIFIVRRIVATDAGHRPGRRPGAAA